MQASDPTPSSNSINTLTIVLPTLGVILVALITGIFNWLQSRSALRAKTAAAISASDAASYAVGLEAKSAAIDGLQEQVKTLEELREQDREVIAELRHHVEECVESERAASLLQRDMTKRIEELEARVGNA